MNIVISRKIVLSALLSITVAVLLTTLISPSKVMAQGSAKQFKVEATLEVGKVQYQRVVDPDTGAKCYVQLQIGSISCIK